MDIEQLSLLYALLIGVSDPVRKLSSVYAKLKRSGAAADRIFELMDRETRVLPARNPQPLPRLAGQIEFQNVSFRYATKDPAEERRPEALRGISLNVKAGEVIAVVGENGSGKSTLVNLLPRFYDPDHGAVCIDGLDIRKADLRDLRGQIGVVTQETLLFDATIAENIRYGRSTATDEDVEQAARHAHVLQFAEQLPEGLRTQIGGKGGRLSGGQRQRIAMARALLRDPAILILDEATSAIDAHSEFLIHKTLREYAAGRTTFIITHSVSQSILDFVSRIVVMEQGELLACGPHESLMQSCPAYVGLFQAQTQQRSA
jgi:subfamily B ATP-binding cassette protein MsbA